MLMLIKHNKRTISHGHIGTCIISHRIYLSQHFSSCVTHTGQTNPGSRAVINGGLGASDESAKQLELPHLQFDGEDQREVWTDPQSGEQRVIHLRVSIKHWMDT